MKSRTDTMCNECMHNKVCGRLNRPEKIVNAIRDFNPEDDNGIDIVVSCINFERSWNQIKGSEKKVDISNWEGITSDPFCGKGW